MQYVVALARKVAEAANDRVGMGSDRLNVFQLLNCLAEELDRFSPVDFLPSARLQFVFERERVRGYRNMGGFDRDKGAEIQSLIMALIPVLEAYSHEGRTGPPRSFPFVHDPDLKVIIERDFGELMQRVFPSGAWKSAVVLAGSILEAILLDQLSEPSVLPRANAAKAAPRDKSGRLKDLTRGEWRLESLINVAVELNILAKPRADTIDQVLRDYRNFVHPAKERRAGHPCTDAEAYLAVGALGGVCNHLT